jgi:hypothetical protein
VLLGVGNLANLLSRDPEHISNAFTQ